jgi:hypothetical protein
MKPPLSPSKAYALNDEPVNAVTDEDSTNKERARGAAVSAK